MNWPAHFRFYNKRPFVERFEAMYMPEPNSGCWLWLGSLGMYGYGQITDAEGNQKRAPKASWEHHKGRKVPGALWVLHKCDTPSCVNPDHLFIGTPADNCHDMIAKGRNSRGAAHAAAGAPRDGINNPAAKLSVADVLALRATPAGNRGWKTALARQYGITPSTLTTILNRKLWSHV